MLMTRIRHIRLSRTGDIADTFSRATFSLSPSLLFSLFFSSKVSSQRKKSRGKSFGVSRDAPRAKDIAGDPRSYKSSRARAERRCSGRNCSPIKCIRTVSGVGIRVGRRRRKLAIEIPAIIEGSSIPCLFWYVSVDSEMVHLSCIPDRERDWMDGFMRTSLQMDWRFYI